MSNSSQLVAEASQIDSAQISSASTDLPTAVPSELLYLLAILGVLIFLWDLFDRKGKKLQKKSQIETDTKIVALENDSKIPTREFYSTSLGLQGKPDALVKEDGFLIPVDIVPMSSKVQDRHVIKLLTYLCLIEEQEGKSSPYGILLMGKKRRMVKVKNTPEKQRWMLSLVDEMHSIMDGVPAVPKPSQRVCKTCDVNEICEHRV